MATKNLDFPYTEKKKASNADETLATVRQYLEKRPGRRLAEYTVWNNYNIVKNLLFRYGPVETSVAFAYQVEDDLKKRGATGASIRVYLYAVKLWHAATHNGEKLDISMPPAETNVEEADFLTHKEVKKLLEADLNDRDRAVIALMLGCGLRRKEVSGLNMDDLDIKNRRLHVRANPDADIEYHGTKAKKSGVVSVPVSFVEMLEKYLAWRMAQDVKTNALILSLKGERLTVRGLNTLLPRIGMKAGVKDLHPHKLRHTCASHMGMNGASGVEIMKHLRQSSPVLVERYVHFEENKLRDRVDRSLSF